MNFTETSPGAAWTPLTSSASIVNRKLTVDIDLNNVVTVKVGDDTIWHGTVEDGIAGNTAFNKPRIGFGSSWTRPQRRNRL